MTCLNRIEAGLTSASLMKAALAWADVGVPVLLCWGVDDDGKCDCGKDNCSNPGKHPIAQFFMHGHKSATTNPSRIRRAVRQHPNANLAVVPTEGMLVLDVDGDAGRYI
jgi:hypothetical protein